MRIRMLRDYRFAHLGFANALYLKGQEVDTHDEVFVKTALEDGAAESVVDSPDKAGPLVAEPARPGKPGAPEGSGQETPAASLPLAPASRQTRRNMPKAKRGS